MGTKELHIIENSYEQITIRKFYTFQIVEERGPGEEGWPIGDMQYTHYLTVELKKTGEHDRTETQLHLRKYHDGDPPPETMETFDKRIFELMKFIEEPMKKIMEEFEEYCKTVYRASSYF